jgi:glycosyltransferase involved in cell wall biosynthesis
LALPAQALRSFANRKQIHVHDLRRFPYGGTVIDVVLPVLDEAAAIPVVLERLPAGYRAIVVDNGSTDGSGAIASSLGALVVSEARRGFGAACYAGLFVARSEVVCFMDCDASLDAAQLPRVADPVRAGRVDLMIGARRAERGAWPVHARIANRTLGAIVRRRAGVAIADLGPMRAARRDALLALDLRDRRFGWPLEMVLRAAEAGWRIDQTEVDYAPRIGKSKVTGTASGTARTVRDMAAVLRQ